MTDNVEEQDKEVEKTTPKATEEIPAGEGNHIPRSSLWDLLYGTFFEPVVTMERIAEEKLLWTALLLNMTLFIFMLIMGLLVGRSNLGFLPWIPQDMAELMPSMIAGMTLIGSLSALVLWFIKAAVYQLIGQFFGARSNGIGLMAALGFAVLPQFLLSPINLVFGAIPFLAWLGMFMAFVILLWGVVLEVMAIRGALGLSWGWALFVYFLPWVAFFFFVLIAGILLAAFLMPLFSSLSDIPF